MIDIQASTIRARLQTRIARSGGEEFRALFAQIFDPRNADVVPIAQARSDGGVDRDWYERDSGRYYHVHTPEAFDEVSAVTSIVHVLQGLHCRFSDRASYPRGITEFYFVVNDAYRMTPARCSAMSCTLEAYRRKYRLQRCRLFLANDLEDALMALDRGRLQAISGYIPDFGAALCRSRELIAQVLTHIAATQPQKSAAGDQGTALDFARLIHPEPWLAQARSLGATVQQVLGSQPQICKIDIRARLEAVYQNSRLRNFSDIPGGPTRDDQRLEYMISEIMPKLDSGDRLLMQALQAAVIAVIAAHVAGPERFDAASLCYGNAVAAARAADTVLGGFTAVGRSSF